MPEDKKKEQNLFLLINISIKLGNKKELAKLGQAGGKSWQK